MNKPVLLFLLIIFTNYSSGQWEPSEGKEDYLAGLPYIHDRQLSVDLLYTDPTLLSGQAVAIRISMYGYEGKDSQLLYRHYTDNLYLAAPRGKYRLQLLDKDEENWVLPQFRHTVERTQMMPPGQYKVYFTLIRSGGQSSSCFLYHTDPLLQRGSELERKLAALLEDKQHLFSGQGKEMLLPLRVRHRRKAIERMARSYGLDYRLEEEGGRSRIAFYYDNKLFRYKNVEADQTIASYLQERQSGRIPFMSPADSGYAFPSFESLTGTFRNLWKQNEEEDQALMGNIRMSSYFNSDYDAFSQVDNNVYEIQGDLSMPVFGIPVQVAGFYTSQDRNRLAKASYLNFSYDKGKAQEKLAKLISSFRQGYEEAQSQGENYKMVYGVYIDQLKKEQGQLEGAFRSRYGIGFSDLNNMVSLGDRGKELLKQKVQERVMEELKKEQGGALSGMSDSAAELKERVERKYEEALAKYEQLLSIREKAEQYISLAQQLYTTIRLDSALVLDKIKDLKNTDNLSNKDLYKKAAELLPEGKAKTLLAGLTRLQGGIFSKYASKYTLAGQTLKGLDFGYDIGVAEVGITYGRSEYISRKGEVEGYRTLSNRVKTKPFLGQQVSLGYDMITAEKALAKDGQFMGDKKGAHRIINLPGLLNPVHIVSLQHEGGIGQYVTLNTEFAYSDIKGQSEEATAGIPFFDKTAFSADLTAELPKTDFRLTAGYERMGRHYENNLLPVNMSGVERLNARIEGGLLRSTLFLGLEYNYLLQQHLYARGRQSKWGFDIRTRFKKLPNVSVIYKPYTTFRSMYDTLSIPQREILGSVLNGRLSYQHKSGNRIMRIGLLYTENRSEADTVRYRNRMAQLMLSYMQDRVSALLNIGSMRMESGYAESRYPAYDRNEFIQAQVQYRFSERLSAGFGGDIGRSSLGLSRYGLQLSGSYMFVKIPVGIRIYGRSSSFILEEAMPWKKIYGGGIDISYRLYTKLR